MVLGKFSRVVEDDDGAVEQDFTGSWLGRFLDRSLTSVVVFCVVCFGLLASLTSGGLDFYSKLVLGTVLGLVVAGFVFRRRFVSLLASLAGFVLLTVCCVLLSDMLARGYRVEFASVLIPLGLSLFMGVSALFDWARPALRFKRLIVLVLCLVFVCLVSLVVVVSGVVSPVVYVFIEGLVLFVVWYVLFLLRKRA